MKTVQELYSEVIASDELKQVAGGTDVTGTFNSNGETCDCSDTCIRDCC